MTRSPACTHGLSNRWLTAALAGVCAAFGPSLDAEVTQPRPSAATLLHLSFLASGGDRWKAIAQIDTSGDLDLAGVRGTFEQRVDVRNGRDALKADAGPVHVTQVSLTDSSWQLDRSGIVTYADTPRAKADAINQSFIDRNGWFGPAGRSATYVSEKKDSARTYDLVSLTPAGGRPMTLWLGRADHLLYRIDQLDASHQPTSLILSDYRRLAGVLIPYVVRQSNGAASQDTIETVRVARVSIKLDADAWTAPASRFSDAVLLSNQASATVPFTLVDGRIEVEIAVDGHAPLPFLVDTGASNVLTPEAARTLGLTGAADIPVGGTGAAQAQGQLTTVRTLQLGAVRMTEQPFIVTSLPGMLQDRGGKPPIAGLVGAELLRRFPTIVDYGRSTLIFYRPGSTPPRPLNAEPVRLLFNEGHPFVELHVDSAAGVFSVDTGDNSGITVFRHFYKLHRFPVEQPGLPLVQGGVGGRSEAMLTRVDSVRLGSFTLRRPLINLSLATRGGFSEAEVAGNLGQRFLRNFVLSFDYEHRVLYVGKAESFGTPADYNRSGLMLDRADDGALIANQVVPGSPAARAGLVASDTVMSINGKNTEHIPLELVDYMLAGPPGSSITGEVLRHGERHKIAFTLQELLPTNGTLRPLDIGSRSGRN